MARRGARLVMGAHRLIPPSMPQGQTTMQRNVSTLAKAAICISLMLASGATHAQAAVWSGPFGLQQGLTPAEVGARINIRTLDAPEMYAADTVPTPDPAFASYQLTFSSTSGLCAVVGVGPDKPADGAGVSLRQDFNALRQAIIGIHGVPERDLDLLSEGSKWTEPAQYLESLASGDRTLLVLWRSTEAKPLNASLNTIALMANAASPTTADISVHYRFSNNAQCEAEKRALEKQARDKRRAVR
jgi:hypothetical protein